MREPIVTDSTCLIGLERIGRIDLLPALFEPVIVPPLVHQEFGVPLPWLQIEAPSDPALVAALKILVDDGEAEAIALASASGHRIILDDRQARLVAKQLGVTIIGTIGFLVRAKRTGLIVALKPVLNELGNSGFYLTDALKEEALRLVGE